MLSETGREGGEGVHVPDSGSGSSPLPPLFAAAAEQGAEGGEPLPISVPLITLTKHEERDRQEEEDERMRSQLDGGDTLEGALSSLLAPSTSMPLTPLGSEQRQEVMKAGSTGGPITYGEGMLTIALPPMEDDGEEEAEAQSLSLPASAARSDEGSMGASPDQDDLSITDDDEQKAEETDRSTAAGGVSPTPPIDSAPTADPAPAPPSPSDPEDSAAYEEDDFTHASSPEPDVDPVPPPHFDQHSHLHPSRPSTSAREAVATPPNSVVDFFAARDAQKQEQSFMKRKLSTPMEEEEEREDAEPAVTLAPHLSLCEFCFDATVAYRCAECHKEFCADCFTDAHRLSSLRSHVRDPIAGASLPDSSNPRRSNVPKPTTVTKEAAHAHTRQPLEVMDSLQEGDEEEEEEEEEEENEKAQVEEIHYEEEGEEQGEASVEEYVESEEIQQEQDEPQNKLDEDPLQSVRTDPSIPEEGEAALLEASEEGELYESSFVTLSDGASIAEDLPPTARAVPAPALDHISEAEPPSQPVQPPKATAISSITKPTAVATTAAAKQKTAAPITTGHKKTRSRSNLPRPSKPANSPSAAAAAATTATAAAATAAAAAQAAQRTDKTALRQQIRKSELAARKRAEQAKQQQAQEEAKQQAAKLAEWKAKHQASPLAADGSSKLRRRKGVPSSSSSSTAAPSVPSPSSSPPPVSSFPDSSRAGILDHLFSLLVQSPPSAAASPPSPALSGFQLPPSVLFQGGLPFSVLSTDSSGLLLPRPWGSGGSTPQKIVGRFLYGSEGRSADTIVAVAYSVAADTDAIPLTATQLRALFGVSEEKEPEDLVSFEKPKGSFLVQKVVYLGDTHAPIYHLRADWSNALALPTPSPLGDLNLQVSLCTSTDPSVPPSVALKSAGHAHLLSRQSLPLSGCDGFVRLVSDVRSHIGQQGMGLPMRLSMYVTYTQTDPSAPIQWYFCWGDMMMLQAVTVGVTSPAHPLSPSASMHPLAPVQAPPRRSLTHLSPSPTHARRRDRSPVSPTSVPRPELDLTSCAKCGMGFANGPGQLVHQHYDPFSPPPARALGSRIMLKQLLLKWVPSKRYQYPEELFEALLGDRPEWAAEWTKLVVAICEECKQEIIQLKTIPPRQQLAPWLQGADGAAMGAASAAALSPPRLLPYLSRAPTLHPPGAGFANLLQPERKKVYKSTNTHTPLAERLAEQDGFDLRTSKAPSLAASRSEPALLADSSPLRSPASRRSSNQHRSTAHRQSGGGRQTAIASPCFPPLASRSPQPMSPPPALSPWPDRRSSAAPSFSSPSEAPAVAQVRQQQLSSLKKKMEGAPGASPPPLAPARSRRSVGSLQPLQFSPTTSKQANSTEEMGRRPLSSSSSAPVQLPPAPSSSSSQIAAAAMPSSKAAGQRSSLSSARMSYPVPSVGVEEEEESVAETAEAWELNEPLAASAPPPSSLPEFPSAPLPPAPAAVDDLYYLSPTLSTPSAFSPLHTPVMGDSEASSLAAIESSSFATLTEEQLQEDIPPAKHTRPAQGEGHTNAEGVFLTDSQAEEEEYEDDW